VADVLSANVNRRNLSTGPRAMAVGMTGMMNNSSCRRVANSGLSPESPWGQSHCCGQKLTSHPRSPPPSGPAMTRSERPSRNSRNGPPRVAVNHVCAPTMPVAGPRRIGPLRPVATARVVRPQGEPTPEPGDAPIRGGLAPWGRSGDVLSRSCRCGGRGPGPGAVGLLSPRGAITRCGSRCQCHRDVTDTRARGGRHGDASDQIARTIRTPSLRGGMSAI